MMERIGQDFFRVRRMRMSGGGVDARDEEQFPLKQSRIRSGFSILVV